MTQEELEQKLDWIIDLKSEGHLSKWHVVHAIDSVDGDQLKDLLRFLIIEEIIKIGESED